MAHVNDHYLKLKAGYLFPEITKRVTAFIAANPHADVISLGIGDVVKGIPRPLIDAMKEAVEEMAHDDTLQGYPPDQGQDFLRTAIADHDFRMRGAIVSDDEIFVSDGSKCDSGNVQEIFADTCTVALTDPVYPVYCDSNVMAGRTGPANENGSYAGLVYMPCTADNGFVPDQPAGHVDLIYLCSPNNPTGAAMSREDLTRWVSYARYEGAVILFDAAYESYITDPAIPHSIYEIDGARDVAIEFRSFSKNAGFTGLRCGYTVVPKDLKGYATSGEEVDLHRLWARRHATKFNGVGYPVQRAAAAVYTPAGQRSIAERVSFYMENATIMRQELEAAGFTVHGGEHAPYLWMAVPNGVSSWECFDILLAEAHVISTPGAGFGAFGEGYVRLSAFNHRDRIEEAVERIKLITVP